MSRRPLREPSADADAEATGVTAEWLGDLRFGPYELDETTGELRRRGVRVWLQPQPAKLLALLARNAGRLVSREEIRKHLWGGTLVDYDQGIHYAIRQIRRALRDQAEAPRFVETVPGRGYRLLAQVEHLGGGRGTPDRPFRRLAGWRLASLGALAILVAWGGWLVLSSDGDRAERLSLLVLPFQTPGETGKDAWLGDKLTEELIGGLTRRWGADLDVLASETVHRLTELGLQPAAVEADFVVEGTVQRTSTGLRVTVRLASARDASQLWANDFDRAEVRELPEVLAEIGARIANALGLQLALEPEPWSRRAWRPEVEGLRQRARDLLDRWLFVFQPDREEKLRRAHRLLEDCLDLDPAYAPALVEMARFHLWGEGPLEGGEKARLLLDQALDLDEGLEAAHIEMGNLLLFVDVDLDGAEREVERALSLNPGSALAHYLRACLLTVQGRPEEAKAASRRAIALNPLSDLFLADMAWDRLMARRPDEAIDLARRAFELSHNRRTALGVLIAAHLQRRDFASAVAEVQRWMDEVGVPAEAHSWLDRLAPREAMAAYHRWYLTEVPVGGDAVLRAAMHTSLGEHPQALTWLEDAVRDPSEITRVYLAVDPRFDPLRGEPRFGELLAKLFQKGRPPVDPDGARSGGRIETGSARAQSVGSSRQMKHL